MLLPKTNIAEKLTQAKFKSYKSETDRLKEIYSIFSEVDSQFDRIGNNISTSNGTPSNNFNLELLNTKNIFHTNEIKQICIDYRLRFLDTKYFKGEIPYEAISIIKSLEKTHLLEIKGFKIIAPSKLFKLKDKDDPVLFAPIGNGYFYLIHKWGNDLHPLRKILMWPFKSIVNLTVLVFLLSFILTFMVPEGLFSKTNSTKEFWIINFFIFKCVAAIVIFYGFALGKNFNPIIWNSKYFNS
tara:strand:- start:5285 stop:6007 length:723 start_codon:yes stop_codon:yes gene_type:complete